MSGHPFFDEGESKGTSRYSGPYLGTVQVNVTYENASPAVGVMVSVYQYDSWSYYGDQGLTDGLGSVDIPITTKSIGPCYITVANGSEALWTRSEIYIEPLKHHYRDIVLVEGLAYDNVIIGVVRNLSSGSPISGVPVSLNGFDALGRHIVLEKKSGPGGNFDFSVPYSDTYYNIWTYDGESRGTMEYSNTIIINRSKTTYDVDIYLRPIPPNRPLNIRFTQMGTGDPIQDAYGYIQGLAANNDHIPWADYSARMLTPSGWFNSSVGRGEYRIELSRSSPLGNGSCHQTVELGVIMNDTPIEKEVEIPLTTVFRAVTLTVQDSVTMAPIPSVSISSGPVLEHWYGGTITSNTWGSGGPIGKAVIPVIPDKDIMIRVYTADIYRTVDLPIEAGPVGDDPNIVVSLVKEPPIPITPLGNISLLVKDERTGAVIPNEYIRGEMIGEPYMGFYGNADDFGYLNKTVKAGHYTTVKVFSSLGTGEIYDLVVQPGMTTSKTIYITERRDYSKEKKVEFSFRLVDTSGSPILNFPLSVMKKEGDEFYTGICGSSSDGTGWVRLTLPSGNYILWAPSYMDGISQSRPHWSFIKDAPLHVPPDGGIGQDAVAYSSYPLSPFTGAVKELVTGRSIPGAEILYRSGLDNREGSRFEIFDILPFDVNYLASSTVSDLTGRFRIWGKDRIRYLCSAPGYFPRSGEEDMSGGALNRNIYLEPLLHSTLYLNGTMVDYLDLPVEGSVEIYDMDREFYPVNSTTTGPDGAFSLGVYPGRFEIRYGNDTLMESMVMDVTSTMEDLILVVTPECIIEGYVLNGTGVAMSGITVELLSEGSQTRTNVSESTGLYHFEVPPGSYTLKVAEGNENDEFLSGSINAPPLGYYFQNITLAARTSGELMGSVIGDRPGSSEVIMGAYVRLADPDNETISMARSDEDGGFLFDDLSFGTGYTLWVDPPTSMAADRTENRSGYLPVIYGPFEMGSRYRSVEVLLEYLEFTPRGYYNITSYSPTGSDVYLNEPVVVQFSHSMEVLTLTGNFTIVPELVGMTVEWFNGNMTLALGHLGFRMNTTYTVTVFGSLRSVEGYHLYKASYQQWNFTTGMDELTWWLDSKDIKVAPDRTVSIQATGANNISVFFVVDGLGSGELFEGPDGTYTGAIDRSKLVWDTVYYYHFSDTDNGTDMAPMLSGSFRTLKEPVEWKIISASVKLDVDGNWIIEVTANPGLGIWFVIDGLGSFKLTETAPGNYGTTVAGDRFEPGKEYSYWFSDSDDGTDKAPAFAGRLKAKGSVDGPGGNSWWVCLVIGAVILLVIILIAVLAIVLKGRKGEEKEEGWGEE